MVVLHYTVYVFSTFLKINVIMVTNTDLNIGEAIIRGHCDTVRNDVQLAIEQAYEKLDKIHKELMDEIDVHEKLCQDKFKLIQQDKEQLET